MYGALFLCCNKQKLLKAQKKELLHEEHEILRETFSKLIRALNKKVDKEEIQLNNEKIAKLKDYLEGIEVF